jgi:hypothetical protein
MKRSNRLATIAATGLSALPMIAPATELGPYVGASLGRPEGFEPEEYDLDSPPFPFVQDSEDDEGIKWIVGYRIFDWLSVEANRVELGGFGGYIEVACIPEIPCGDAFDFEGEALSLAALPGLQVGPVNLFARAGITRWEVERRSRFYPQLNRTLDGEELLLGLGAELRLGHFGLRLEAERHPVDEVDVDVISLGATWTF